jgi:UDPglucose 6-dehydrogenase
VDFDEGEGLMTSQTPGGSTDLQMSVVGCGYLGAVHAAAMASLGHRVVGVDSDPDRVAGLSAGTSPLYEPGLDNLLRRGLDAGRLSFTTDVAEAAGARLHFLCVGTPQSHHQYAADLSYVERAVTDLLGILEPGDVVVGKSTVPVGTAARLAARVREAAPGATLVWNPEFLREGFAIEDTLRPDRVVLGIGTEPDDDAARELLLAAYAGILDGTPLIVTSYPTAELVKVAANSFLATKISFINAMADLCELAGADVTELADAIGHDTRIGRRFLNAGLGFGGGCLPKDIRAFMARAGELGADDTLTFLREVDMINLRRRQKTVEMVREWLGGDLRDRSVAVLGAAFKPDSDDIRDSPALAVAEALHLTGANVVVTDPRARRNAERQSPQLAYADSAEEAATGADVVLLLTEWRDFVGMDPELLGKVVRSRRILDARNALDPRAWQSAGWVYRALGRPLVGG